MSLRPDWTKPRREPSSLIDLSTNICYDHHVEREINTIIHSAHISVNDYGDEIPVYNAISAYHNVPIENITLGFGLGELYGRIVDIFQHHRFAIHTPTWEFASVACKVRDVPYVEIHDLHVVPSASILYVSNPSGVTGDVFNKYTLQGISQKYNTVIVDESYGEYSTIPSSVIDSVNDYNIIVLKTLSKSLGVAGLRIGYAIANKNLTNMMQERRPSSTTSSLASLLAPKLFDMIPNHVGRMTRTREWLISKYNLKQTNGNYVLFDEVPDEISTNFKTKKQTNNIRMTLTNLETILNAIHR